MLHGNSLHSIDTKNRVFLPAQYKDELGESVVITCDECGQALVGCLQVMPSSVWEEYSARFANIARTNLKLMGLVRRLLVNATTCEPDKQGRIIIPQSLKRYAGIYDKVMFAGVGNRVELWDPARWEIYSGRIESDPQLSDNLELLTGYLEEKPI